MLTSLHLMNFKGFRDTQIPEFRKVNLILGGQNVGKTSLLEAIVFVAGDIDNQQSIGARKRLSRMFRPCEGNDAVRFWRGIVGTGEKPINIEVRAEFGQKCYSMSGYLATENSGMQVPMDIEGIGRVVWALGGEHVTVGKDNRYWPTQSDVPHPFPSFSKSSLEQVELYGQLVISKKKQTILKLLKLIETRLESIDAVAPDGEHRVYVDLADGHVLPLSQLGHGFTRLFELYAGLAVTDSKLALIDEIENGIHYSALPMLFQGVRQLSESNGVQSMITTHSLECIRSAYEVFKDKPQDFQLIRLERTNDNNIRAVAVNDKNLDTVMASRWEIR